MIRPARPARAGLRRAALALAAVAMVVLILPAVPAYAAGGLCYVATGKPYEPGTGGGGVGGGLTGPGMTPQGPVVWCDQLTAYTQPDTLFGGSGDKITDRAGNSIDDYYFDDGYRGLSDTVSHPTVRLSTWAANLVFSLAQLFVWCACWLVNVSLNFGLADALLGPVAQAANSYQVHVVDRLGLVNLALMICVFFFGLAALRGRIGQGVGEILLSFGLAALGAVLLAAPADTILGDHGLLGQTRDFGVSIAALPMADLAAPCAAATPGCDSGGNPDGGDGPTANDVAKPFQYAMIDTFIRKPHQQMAYGVIFDQDAAKHPCLDTYNKIIATDRKDSDESVMYPEMAKCDPRLAESLRQDNGTRIVTALLVAVGALVMLAYVFVGVSIPLLGGQLALAALAVLAVVAIPVSLTGGPGRRALWLWVGATASVLAAMVAAFWSMAFFLLAVHALASVGGDGFLLRMLLIDAAAILLLSVHRRIAFSTRHHVRYAVRKLDRGKVGGSGMGGMGMARAWSVRGVWRDVERTNEEAGRIFQRIRDIFRRNDTGEADSDGEGEGEYRRQRTDGDEAGGPPPPVDCGTCGGDGTISVWVESIDDWEEQPCPACGGTGLR